MPEPVAAAFALCLDELMQTRSQSLAGTVWQCVDGVASNDWADDYVGLCKRFPLLVLHNGLAQAVGYLLVLEGRGKARGTAAKHLLEDLAPLLLDLPTATVDELRKEVVNCELPVYRRLTRRALEASKWFKRFSESRIEERAGP